MREPEWTEQDQAEVLALALYRSLLCPCGCGQQYTDTTSAEDDGPDFVVRKIRCRARDALLTEQNALTRTPRPEALLWRVEKR